VVFVALSAPANCYYNFEREIIPSYDTSKIGQMNVHLLRHAEAALQSFVSSKAGFHLLSRTLQRSIETRLETENLFILDSSYNPPTLAHAALAKAALEKSKVNGSRRLLVLFSTANADKAPKPASFADRLVMISLFVQELDDQLQGSVKIDIGLASAARYMDKSAAIKESGVYQGNPIHVHLMGYDTVIRFLAPKYYSDFNPPLSALEPYFSAGNGIQVLLRPEPGSDLEEQKAYVEGVSNGALDSEGFQKSWANQIEALETHDADGISSTAVRTAVKNGDWKEVSRNVGVDIREWIRDSKLYQEE
jgi:nicotinamide-nucleotide adenylyltransferase